MSTSLLYHGFGIRGYTYVRTAYEGGTVIFTIHQERGDLRCAVCGSRRVIRHGAQARRFRGLPIGRGQRYLTVVLDLESGAVVFVGDGKGVEALQPFWKRLQRGRAQVEAVAIDMSPAYISAVQTNLPHAILVFDHFYTPHHSILLSRQTGPVFGGQVTGEWITITTGRTVR